MFDNLKILAEQKELVNYLGSKLEEGNTVEAKLAVQIIWQISMEGFGLLLVEQNIHIALIDSLKKNTFLRLHALIALKSIIKKSKISIK